MHMLSVAMEPVLHQSCPPNCQDMLAWLPFNVTSNVLSYLDAGKDVTVFQAPCTFISVTLILYLNPFLPKCTNKVVVVIS